ncbi:hypothetical protein GCM10018785_72950 [Streptomyces longispororuber]|uniref:Uncharacterized protein n=1 Tax=Streptomyces longispororuber TaxID=68230 RepID=A0A919DYF7_9ACTN|nr:hypothetical protein GCM10018785_72950 [Streptomyces longispororuber]
MSTALRRRGQYGRSRRKGRIRRTVETIQSSETVESLVVTAVHLGSIFLAVYLAIKAQ